MQQKHQRELESLKSTEVSNGRGQDEGTSQGEQKALDGLETEEKAENGDEERGDEKFMKKTRAQTRKVEIRKSSITLKAGSHYDAS